MNSRSQIKSSHANFFNRQFGRKLCFLCAMVLIVGTQYCVYARPSVVLYVFSVLFLLLFFVRFYDYWKNKYILFLLDLCYFINFLSLLFVWVWPDSGQLQAFQFGLANAHAYGGTFLFRNTLVFHDLQKLTSCFIHILPKLFSYLVRWYPVETSVWWYKNFIYSGADRNITVWNPNLDWFWMIGAPLIFHITHEVLYFVIIYGIIKPSDEYLDSFRYLKTQKVLWRLLWKHIGEKWHLIAWIGCNFLLSSCLLFMAVIAWSNFLFHTLMIIVQFITLSWNGACYYVDYYPLQCANKLRVQSILPINHTSTNNNTDTNINGDSNANSKFKSVNSDTIPIKDLNITDDIYGNLAANIYFRFPSPEQISSPNTPNGNLPREAEIFLDPNVPMEINAENAIKLQSK